MGAGSYAVPKAKKMSAQQNVVARTGHSIIFIHSHGLRLLAQPETGTGRNDKDEYVASPLLGDSGVLGSLRAGLALNKSLAHEWFDQRPVHIS